MYQEAINSFEEGISLGGALALTKAFMGHMYAVSGEKAKAWEIVREFQDRSKTAYIPSINFNIVYDGLDEKELAIESLQKAYENRDTLLIFIKVFPLWDRFRHDPRFQEVERRVGLLGSVDRYD
jgi:tetratricopeptide (TPR) repeat protein